MKKTFLVCMALMMIAILGCENEPNRYNKWCNRGTVLPL